MQNGLLTIIVPTYNAERTLGECLKSVCEQNYFNYELLVIDGGSTDRTVDIALSFQSQIPSMRIVSGSDTGIYDAMNKGVSLSHGEWLFFLGADDRFYSQQVLSSIFNRSEWSETVFIYGRAKIQPNNTFTELTYDFEKLLKWNICHQAIFYSRSIFSMYSYDLRYKTLADWDLNFKIFANFPSKAIKSVDVTVCEFSNCGVSANWQQGEEYLKYFSSPAKIYFRYFHPAQAIKKAWDFYKRLGFYNLMKYPIGL